MIFRASAASFGLGGIAPQDRGAAFRRDHGVDRILEHEDAVADGDRQRAAGAAFAGDGHDDGHGQARHFAQVAGDGLGLAALLGVDAGVGAGVSMKVKMGRPNFAASCITRSALR